jgi:anti-sigma factor RsiW
MTQMKKIRQNLDDRLLEYMDGKLSDDEKLMIENLVQTDHHVRQRLGELQETESVLQLLPLEHPAKNFTDSVMSRLDDYPARASFSVRNSILLLFGIVLSIGLGASLLAMGVLGETQTTFHLMQLPLAEKYFRESLPPVTINDKLLLNMILFVNLALALLILDRAILKPFFKRRMEAGH